MIPLSLVVARASNGVIGLDGDLPWRLRSDLQRFKQITMGKPCIMGRKTWDSLPMRPLPGRLNLVLTRDSSFEATGAVVCESFFEAVEIAAEQAEEEGADEVCVIGGVALFELALPRAKRLYITEVDAAPEGDAVFPTFNEDAWVETASERHEPGEKDDHAFTFRVLEKRA